MKPVYYILFFIYTFSFGSQKDKYMVFFKDEIVDASTFLIKSNKVFNHSCKKYKHSKELVTAIIYPELLRYNYLKDFFETSSLELIYVNYGSKAADFSIGHFQMKPSFAEKIENYILKHKQSLNAYKSLNMNKSFGKKAQRKIRVQRLKNLYWQLLYLQAFIDVCIHKYPCLKKESRKNKLRFLASSYNIGINYSFNEIKRRSSFNFFPFGSSYNGNQFCYADISYAYYISKTKKKSL